MQINFHKNKKPLLKLLLVLTLISYILFYTPQNNVLSGDTSYNNDELSNVYFPNTSDGEITIITPENKTYTEPMEGYYHATFGFESNSPGEEGTDINFINRYESDHSLAYVKIIDAMNGHKNVMQLYDGTSSGNANFYAYHDFQTNIEFGTIEFWVLNKEYSGDASGIYYNFGNESGQVYVSFDTFNSLFVLIIDRNNNDLVEFQTGNGLSQWAGLYSEDTWHHIRIDFESTAGGYSGLDQYHLNFWFDGIKRIDNDPMMINDSLGVIATHSHGFDNVRHDYLDAIGYSWDSDYNIGDNMGEGLLLSFENSTTLDWIGYSLDGLSNKTILGNTTITMPNDGSYTIQVFGNDSLGAIYESSIRYFAVDQTQYIEIITPENITYTEPMEGYYPATYGFENDLDGIIPQEWFLGIATGGTAQIVSEIGGRKKVVQMVDTVTNGYPYLVQNFSSQTTGIVEFYVRKESGSTQVGVELRSVGVIATGIRIDYNNNGKFEAYQGASYLEIAAGDYSDQTWFHIKIDFDTSTDTADFYVNGAIAASNVAFKENVVSIDRIYFGPNYLYTGSFYFDAVGYSWDSDYNIGDNLNEGLLLSYDNATTLDWIGYSLDGSPNITITGNTTIPLPEDGYHNIQVFGNDSLGTIYKSDMRYFNVFQYINEYIYINTPENRMYTGPMRGYYPGTYGFEEENDDDMGEDIRFVDYDKSESSSYSKIIPELDGHKKVLEAYDGTTSGRNQVTHHIDDGGQTHGSVEFWFRVSNVYLGNNIYFIATEGGYGIIFGVYNGYFRYNGLGNIVACSSNTWHHIKLEFECSTGGYQGLSQYTWHVYITGILYGHYTFLENKPDVRSLMFYNGYWADSGGHFYYDAFGFSWDSDYNIGDNHNEGLLLSFTNTTDLDWIGYSLDGSPNITITGNKVIPFPEDGVHSIIINGITSNGVLIKSESRDFAVLFQEPHILPVNPYIVPIVLAGIGIGIIALLSIALFLFRRRIPSRSSSTIISHRKPQLNEHVGSGSDLFKFCPLCHAQIKRTDQFCVFCGTSLKND